MVINGIPRCWQPFSVPLISWVSLQFSAGNSHEPPGTPIFQSLMNVATWTMSCKSFTNINTRQTDDEATICLRKHWCFSQNRGDKIHIIKSNDLAWWIMVYPCFSLFFAIFPSKFPIRFTLVLPLVINPYQCENHRWRLDWENDLEFWIFQQTKFDCHRVSCVFTFSHQNCPFLDRPV